jgi:hypothetical protein
VIGLARLTELSHMKLFMYRKCANPMMVTFDLLGSEKTSRPKPLRFKTILEKFFVFSKSIASDLDKFKQNTYTKGVV